MQDGTLRFELFVRDIALNIAFFCDVLRFQVMQHDAGYVALRKGDIVLGLGEVAGLPAGHPLRPSSPTERLGLGIEIVLETDDVEDEYNHVKTTGHPIVTTLSPRPWGATDFRITSPDGYYVRVTSR